MHAVIKLSNDGDEFFRTAIFCQDSPKVFSAESVKCLGQININRVEVSVLFLIAVWQQTPCQQSHAPYERHTDSSVRVYVQDGCWGDSGGLLPEIQSKKILQWLLHTYQVPFHLKIWIMEESLKSYGSSSFTHISWIKVKSLPISTDPPSL